MADNKYQNSQDMCMDWDDEIQNDGQEFVILPEGDYNFTVTDFERGRFPGSAKIPACNKASLTLQVKTDDGLAMIRTDLLLYRTLEWRILRRYVELTGDSENVSVIRGGERIPYSALVKDVERPEG